MVTATVKAVNQFLLYTKFPGGPLHAAGPRLSHEIKVKGSARAGCDRLQAGYAGASMARVIWKVCQNFLTDKRIQVTFSPLELKLNFLSN